MGTMLTTLPSGQTVFYNFLINEVVASQVTDDHIFWCVSPWITDFSIDRPHRAPLAEIVATRGDDLRLFDLLLQMAGNGGQVRIVTGRDETYYGPLRALERRSVQIQVRRSDRLHAKLYVGRYGTLDGSMNMTASGIGHNLERYTYSHDERRIAEARRQADEIFTQAVSL